MSLPRSARAIMVQGTASSVGKSVITAALCRILSQEGLRVAPFKAQNMSNNSFVTAEGGEMGRAQVVQAAAAGVSPSVRMNPILLKPEADHRSQVVVNGQATGSVSGRDYQRMKPELWGVVASALDSLMADYEIVVIEGAGSPAEVNLKATDIVNMRVARHAGSPVLLVGDIDRGGVFASLLGTLELLEPEERRMVRGLVINRFRGDRAVLDPLPEMIAERTRVPVLGVVPHIPDLRLQEEDATALDEQRRPASGGQALTIAVLRFPHISNFDDIDPLARVPGVSIQYVTAAADVAGAHLLVLPGTKSTVSDLRWMRGRGLDKAIIRAASHGTAVIGLCGGYQVLGEALDDPHGVDAGTPDRERGLGLLPVRTTFEPAKTTRQVAFRLNGGPGLLAGAAGTEGHGYEIHTGATRPADGGCPAPAVFIQDGDTLRRDGAADGGGWIIGTYVHGLFDRPQVRDRILGNVAVRHGITLPTAGDFSMDHEFDRLATVVRSGLDMEQMHAILGRSGGRASADPGRVHAG